MGSPTNTPIFPPQTPHFNARKAQMLIIHGTAVDNATSTAIFSGNSAYEVSIHHYINQAGQHTQYLDESVRAYHAGISHWGGFDDINTLSIGIELECISKDASFSHTHESFYTKEQMRALIKLIKSILKNHPIKPWHILAHQDVSAERRHRLPAAILKTPPKYADTFGKKDPGPFFSWEELAQNGIGLWHNKTPIKDALLQKEEVSAFTTSLALYGYDTRPLNTEYGLGQVFQAFHCHFMPWLFGTPFFGKPTKQSLEIIKTLLEKKTTEQ